MFLPRLNPVEPPWYGPVCPVVWEGWRREASPYPDLWGPWLVAIGEITSGHADVAAQHRETGQEPNTPNLVTRPS